MRWRAGVQGLLASAVAVLGDVLNNLLPGSVLWQLVAAVVNVHHVRILHPCEAPGLRDAAYAVPLHERSRTGGVAHLHPYVRGVCSRMLGGKREEDECKSYLYKLNIYLVMSQKPNRNKGKIIVFSIMSRDLSRQKQSIVWGGGTAWMMARPPGWMSAQVDTL